MAYPFGDNNYRSYHSLVRPAGDAMWNPYQGVFGESSPMLDQLVTLLAPQFEGFLGPGVRLGVGRHDNAFDRLKTQKLMAETQKAIADASARDRDAALQIARNAATLAGVNLDTSQMTGFADTFIMPLAQMSVLTPEGRAGLDALGVGGNMMMSYYAHQAGRYMRDPFTNRLGLSGTTSGVVGREIYNQLYGEGSAASMAGLRPMAAGQLLDELTRRGMVGTLSGIDRARESVSFLRETNATAFKSAMQIAGIDEGTDLSRLSGTQIERLRAASPELDTILKGDMRVDARAMAKKMQNYAGAISAMQEIMGPNSPVEELFNALEQMTNGSMSQLDPNRAEMLVRNFNNLARVSGLGLEGMSQLMGMTSQRSSQLGLNPVFASQAAMGGAAYMRHFMQAGMGAPAWGLSGINQLTVMDSNLRLQAADSEAANWAAGIVRMGDMLGIDDPLVKALKNNDVAYLSQNFNFQNAGDVVKYMTRASGGRISAGLAGSMLADTSTNQQVIFNNNLGQTVRNLQGSMQVDPFMRRMAAIKLREGGFSTQAAGAAGGKVVDMIRGLSMEEQSLFLNDEVYRNMMIGQTLMDQFGKDPETLARMRAAGVDVNNQQAVREWFNMQGANVWSGINRNTESRFRNSMANILRLTGSDMPAGVASVMKAVESDSIMQRAMSAVGKDTMAMRIFGAFSTLAQSPRDEQGNIRMDDVRKVIASGLGIEDTSKVTDAMVKASVEMMEQYESLKNSDSYKREQQKLNEAKAKMDAAKTPEERMAAYKAYKEIENQAYATAEVKQLENKMRDVNSLGTIIESQANAGREGAPIKVEFPHGMHVTGTFTYDETTGKTSVDGSTVPAGTTPNPGSK